jgi:potassium efflux system protein
LKELIVPNKEFITGRVLNWTLSDEVTRLLLPIGLGYGTDVENARQLLLKLTQEHPQVLDEPTASVTFEAFGDSTLNLFVRAYVAKMDDRLKVTNELLTTYHRVLGEHQIEIAFPQRDLHIRSFPTGVSWQPPPMSPDAHSPKTSGPKSDHNPSH